MTQQRERQFEESARLENAIPGKFVRIGLW